MRGCLFVAVGFVALVVVLALLPASDHEADQLADADQLSDADYFAAAIAKAESFPRCKVSPATRQILCVTDYEPADLDLYMRALVRLAQERQGWQIDGRTLALDGWTWVVATWPDEHGEAYTVAHDF